MEPSNILPVTVRRSLELLGIVLLLLLIYVAADIIMPLLTAFFIAILLLPLYRWFRKIKIPEVFAITLSIVVFAVIVLGIGWFIVLQLNNLVADFPQIKSNVTVHVQHLSEWINKKMHFSTTKQLSMINEQSNKLFTLAGNTLGGAVGSLTAVFIFVGLLPIYIFLLLFYKNLLLRFVFLWFKQAHHEKVKEVVQQTESMIKSYLLGLIIQITYITVLLGGILLLFGIEHALLIGVIFAILNLIPYVGALIGNILGVLLTLTASTSLTPIFIVLGAITFVQFLDNNILMPRIVGSKVQINALATIVGVIIAGSLAGVSGMFLSLPVIAVLKIIFDRTEHFKQWGLLLGDSRPTLSPFHFAVFRKNKNT